MAEISSTLFKKIRRIQIQTTHLAEDILAGAYRSAFKGRGMEFEEVREYQAGDDPRTIDWNVTARMNRPYVKSFREEREMTVMLIVDLSASTRFGTKQALKRDIITEIAAVIAFSAIKNNDKVGLILFTDVVEKYFPPKKGTRHVLRVIRELLAFKPKDRKTNMGAALAFLGEVQKLSGICFLISDFICSDYSHEAALIANKHDLVSIAVVDPSEVHFPDMNITAFEDLETGEKKLIDTSSSEVKEYLHREISERLTAQKKLMNQLGADFLAIHSEIPYLPQLKKFFILRQRRFR